MRGARTRVLVTGPDIAVGKGAGIQRHVRTLVAGFVDEKDVEITPFSSTSNVYREPWARKGARLVGRYAAFARVVRAFDVIHVNSTIDNRSFLRDAGFVFIAALLRRPVVLQFHGGDISRLAPSLKGSLGLGVRFCLRRARMVLFLSRAQGVPIARLVAFEKVEYVRNYVDVERIVVPRRVSHEGLHVLYLGRLDPLKGVLETIEAFGKVRSRGWRLRIAGAGPLTAEVEARAIEGRGVDFVGFVDDEGREESLEWADVFVLASDHDEGLPYAALEAAASGLALVTSDRGALSSITVEGVTGRIVPPRDTEAVAEALAWFDHHREELARFGSAARDLVEMEFSFTQMREMFGHIYRDLARTSEGSRS